MSNWPKYPDVDYIDDFEKYTFPDELYISFAVCHKNCRNNVFVVDGQTQICEKCGDLNFRTEVRKYRLSGDEYCDYRK